MCSLCVVCCVSPRVLCVCVCRWCAVRAPHCGSAATATGAAAAARQPDPTPVSDAHTTESNNRETAAQQHSDRSGRAWLITAEGAPSGGGSSVRATHITRTTTVTTAANQRAHAQSRRRLMWMRWGMSTDATIHCTSTPPDRANSTVTQHAAQRLL